MNYLLRLREHPLCGFFALSGNNHPWKKYMHMYSVGKHDEDEPDADDHDESMHGQIFGVLMKWDEVLNDIRVYYGEANG